MKVIKDVFKRLTPWAVNLDIDSNFKDENENAEFELKFENSIIGFLKYNDPKWTFEYSEEFKSEKPLLPLIDFPNVYKVYEFEQLMPFFAARIPNMNQPYHEKKIKKHNGNKSSEVSMLKIFGRKSINNPFELSFI